MSSGAFQLSRYVRNNDDVHPIRIQPETLTLTIGGTANAATTGALTSDISAAISKGNRGTGLKPRTITIRFTTAPTGYKQDAPITLPALQEAIWDLAAKGATGTYQGTAIVVVYKSPERAG